MIKLTETREITPYQWLHPMRSGEGGHTCISWSTIMRTGRLNRSGSWARIQFDKIGDKYLVPVGLRVRHIANCDDFFGGRNSRAQL
jgi:hypothetical protein